MGESMWNIEWEGEIAPESVESGERKCGGRAEKYRATVLENSVAFVPCVLIYIT